MESKNLTPQIDAGQHCSYNGSYSTLKTKYEGWSSRERLSVRRWALGSVFPLNRKVGMDFKGGPA